MPYFAIHTICHILLYLQYAIFCYTYNMPYLLYLKYSILCYTYNMPYFAILNAKPNQNFSEGLLNLYYYQIVVSCSTLYIVQCTVQFYSVLCILQCPVHFTVSCTFYSVLYILQCTVHFTVS